MSLLIVHSNRARRAEKTPVDVPKSRRSITRLGEIVIDLLQEGSRVLGMGRANRRNRDLRVFDLNRVVPHCKPINPPEHLGVRNIHLTNLAGRILWRKTGFVQAQFPKCLLELPLLQNASLGISTVLGVGIRGWQLVSAGGCPKLSVTGEEFSHLSLRSTKW